MSFEQIYKEFFKAVFAYIFARMRKDDAAKDIAASVWQKAFKHFDDFDESKGNIRQWLFTIARNEINMYFRLYYVRKFLPLAGYEETKLSDEKSVEEELIYEREKRALLSALDSLDKRERDIIALKFYSGLNNRAIAALAGVSESNAGTIINRSVGKLRVFLEEK